MKPNVLLVVLDSVRARNTSLHDYHRETTPFLESFSERATVWEQARAPSVASLPSHTSIFTGLPAAAHAVENDAARTGDGLVAGHTIWEALAADGYRTGVFSENPYLTSLSVGISERFDTIRSAERQSLPFPDAVDPTDYVQDDVMGGGELVRSVVDGGFPVVANGLFQLARSNRFPLDVLDTPSVHTADTWGTALLDWIGDGPQPWAACLNLMDAHLPYELESVDCPWGDAERLLSLQSEIDHFSWDFHDGVRPIAELEALEDLYDASIRQMDSALESLFEELAARGILDETLVVVTSDHGEGFGEPSNLHQDILTVGHSLGVHECLTHVPLIVKSPGQRSGRRTSDVVSLTAFPSVVRSVRAGEEADFRSDDPVLVSSFGVEPSGIEHDREKDELDPRYTVGCRAVYRDDGTAVRKHAVWDEAAVTLRISSATDSVVIEESGHEGVESAFAEVEDAAVSRGASEATALAPDSRDRLEQLGYL